MTNLLIIEPHMQGHHGVYLRWLVRGALDREWNVTIGTFFESVKHPIFKSLMAESSRQPAIVTLPSPRRNYASRNGFFGLIQREIFYRQVLKRVYYNARKNGWVDFVLVPYLDYCAYATGLLGSPFGNTPWAGLVMRPAFHYDKMGVIAPGSRVLAAKKVLFVRLLLQSSLRLLFTIDPTLYAYLKKSDRLGQKVIYLPDPAELNGQISKQEARQRLQISNTAVVVLVYGTVTRRKGVDILIAASLSPNFPDCVHILIAGKQEPEMAGFLHSPPVRKLALSGKLHEINRFLDDEQEYAVFKSSDMVWLGYRGHYAMSGVLVQAVGMGLPIIACKEGLIGWYARNFRLGPVMGDLNTKGATTAIRAIVNGEYGFDNSRQSAMTWFEAHSRDNFVNTCIGAISRVFCDSARA